MQKPLNLLVILGSNCLGRIGERVGQWFAKAGAIVSYRSMRMEHGSALKSARPTTAYPA